jgi:ferrochelatase
MSWNASRKTGVLLLNLGTPDAPETAPVRRYLREFLYDPRVIDIHPVGRMLLLEGAILPFRPSKSAEAYKKIWTDKGSPLLFHSVALKEAVQAKLGAAVPVELGMQYGNPSIPSALESLRQQQVEQIVVAPLYPQYSASSTGSALEKVYQHASTRWVIPAISTVGAFYDHPGFIEAFRDVARPVIDALNADHVLFSYHGLPERHMRKADDSGAHCLASKSCCDTLTPVNRNCYRAQCVATTKLLAQALQLAPEQYSLSFQSRLGRTPWIQPYTDLVIPELAKQGKRRIAVLCPAFVADCLETLEEIGLRAREQFKAEGGEELVLVPSLNATPRWIDAVVELLRDAQPVLASRQAV